MKVWYQYRKSLLNANCTFRAFYWYEFINECILACNTKSHPFFTSNPLHVINLVRQSYRFPFWITFAYLLTILTKLWVALIKHKKSLPFSTFCMSPFLSPALFSLDGLDYCYRETLHPHTCIFFHDLSLKLLKAV